MARSDIALVAACLCASLAFGAVLSSNRCAEADARYRLADARTNVATDRTGPAMLEGIPVRVGAGEERRLIVERR